MRFFMSCVVAAALVGCCQQPTGRVCGDGPNDHDPSKMTAADVDGTDALDESSEALWARAEEPMSFDFMDDLEDVERARPTEASEAAPEDDRSLEDEDSFEEELDDSE